MVRVQDKGEEKEKEKERPRLLGELRNIIYYPGILFHPFSLQQVAGFAFYL